MLKLIARLQAQPGQGSVVASALCELAGPSREETGCILYDVCRLQSDPDALLVLEEWESQAALDAHMEMPHFKAFLAAAGSALAGAPELMVLERL
jgi:quinol monooxygenase YgiN